MELKDPYISLHKRNWKKFIGSSGASYELLYDFKKKLCKNCISESCTPFSIGEFLDVVGFCQERAVELVCFMLRNLGNRCTSYNIITFLLLEILEVVSKFPFYGLINSTLMRFLPIVASKVILGRILICRKQGLIFSLLFSHDFQIFFS